MQEPKPAGASPQHPSVGVELGLARVEHGRTARCGTSACPLCRELTQQKARIEQQNQQLTRDLELARQVQQALIPHQAVEVPGLEIAWLYEPANQVGGDLLDVIPLPTGQVLVFVGDAVGHGVSAALLKCIAKTALQPVVDRHERRGGTAAIVPARVRRARLT